MAHPWHDLPNNPEFMSDGVNAVIEIPKGSKVKYELDVFRDCAKGITRNTPDLSSSRPAKSGASEPEETLPAVEVDAEK